MDAVARQLRALLASTTTMRAVTAATATAGGGGGGGVPWTVLMRLVALVRKVRCCRCY